MGLKTENFTDDEVFTVAPLMSVTRDKDFHGAAYAL